MDARFCLPLLVLLSATASQAAAPDFPFSTPDHRDWWRREVPRGRPLDADVHNSLTSGLAKLAAPDWGAALAEPGRMSIWDLGVDAGGLRHVGFRGDRRFKNGTDPGEWEGTLVFNPA